MRCRINNVKNYVPINNREIFCLDTNVLYWYCYPRSIEGMHPVRKSEIQAYYDFVDRLVENGNPLVVSVYNVTEFLNVIEKRECEIYRTLHPEFPIGVKDLRGMLEERERLAKNMRVGLNNVKETCKIVDQEITISILDKFVDRLEQHKCDVFDFAVLENYIKEENLNIVTDDSDFSTIESIHIFTANQAMLSLKDAECRRSSL